MLFTSSKTEDSWPGLKPRSFSLECGAETGQGSNLEVLILNMSYQPLIRPLNKSVILKVVWLTPYVSKWRFPWLVFLKVFHDSSIHLPCTFSFSSDCQGRHVMRIKCLQLVEWLVYLMGCFQNCVFSFPQQW